MKNNSTHFTILAVVLLIAFAGISLWMLKGGLETKKAGLEEAIAYLKSDYEFARISVQNKTVLSIHFNLSLLDTAGKTISQSEFNLDGNDIFLESRVIVLSGQDKQKSVVFPVRIYTEKIAPSDGTNIISLYSENDFPKTYDVPDLGSEIRPVITKLFNLTKSGEGDVSWKEAFAKITINMEASLHQSSGRGYEAGKTYSCIVHPNGGLELLEVK